MFLDPFRMQRIAAESRWVNRVKPLFTGMCAISERLASIAARRPEPDDDHRKYEVSNFAGSDLRSRSLCPRTTYQ